MAGAIILSIICIACAYLLWRLAEKRGANTLFWATMGAIFGPLAIPFVFLTKNKSSKFHIGVNTIVRLWHGKVDASQADEYAAFMKERAAPDYRSVDGLKKLFFLRRVENNVAHFLLVTLWDSMESVKKFAGEQPEKAKYYPEDDQFLLEKEETVSLYDVFFEK